MKLDHQHTWGTTAVISGDSATPRSYVIETQQGATLRRNRRHLQHVPVLAGDTPAQAPDGLQQEAATQQPDGVIATDTASPTPTARPPPARDGLLYTRSGRLSKPVDRLTL